SVWVATKEQRELTRVLGPSPATGTSAGGPSADTADFDVAQFRDLLTLMTSAVGPNCCFDLPHAPEVAHQHRLYTVAVRWQDRLRHPAGGLPEQLWQALLAASQDTSAS